LRRFLFTICLCALVFAACSRHDDNPPPQLPLADPPQPRDFQVSTQDSVVYDLSWTVSDPTVVVYYRVYTQVLIEFVEAQVDTTSSTSVHVDLGAKLPVAFCVSSVTYQNVESPLTCKSGQ
jgi:hypothetical protein